jgi:cysteine desulfurase
MDHAATTPLHKDVLAAMLPYYTERYGNPSSIHRLGRRANVALNQARNIIAQTLGARSSEIIFTSGGSEGANTALRGIALARRSETGANRIITTAVEHHAVLHTAEDLRDHYGFDLTVLPVDEDGAIRLEEVERSLGNGRDVALVSVMIANNEIGTIQPVADIGRLCRDRGAPFHTDAVQAVGRLSLKVDDLHIDALSVSAHKFYGPKGAGFLYLRGGVSFLPYLTGGSHENNRRAGTENVASIVGMARALQIAESERLEESARLRLLRDQLIGGVLEALDGARLTGSPLHRLDNHASFVIAGIEAEGVLIALDLAGIAASSGSACTSAAQQPSHVLTALGFSASQAVGALRLTLGRSTTAEDVNYLLEVLPPIITRLKG